MVTVAALLCLASSASGQWILNDGTKVSFVFVQPSQKQAWRPSGEAVPYDSLPRPTGPVWTAQDSDAVLVALLNPPRHFDGAPSIRFKLPATEELDSTFSLICSDHKIWMAGYKPTAIQPAEQDLAVGIANGPWKVQSWVEFRTTGYAVHAVKVHGAPVRLSVSGSGPTMAGPYTYVKVPPLRDMDNLAYRFVVKSRDGRTMEYLQKMPGPGASTTFQFQGSVETVSQVILQIRTFEWHTLRVAHFRSGSN